MQDLWYGTFLTPEVIAYNTQVIPRDSAPQDWDDLLQPKWKGKIIIRDPIASGTMRAIFGAIIARSVAQTGSPQAGFQWLKRLDANTREYTLNPTILYQKLGRREGVLTLWDMPDVATMRDRVGIPIDYIIPKSGTPLLVDAIAIVHGTPHPREARLYYEFVTSREAEITSARKFLRIPGPERHSGRFATGVDPGSRVTNSPHAGGSIAAGITPERMDALLGCTYSQPGGDGEHK